VTSSEGKGTSRTGYARRQLPRGQKPRRETHEQCAKTRHIAGRGSTYRRERPGKKGEEPDTFDGVGWEEDLLWENVFTESN